MIISFFDKETETVWNGSFSKRLPPPIQVIARRKLRMINNAQQIEDLRIPSSNQLEQLYKKRVGQWSVRINNQWRICFIWNEGNVSRVEICDYH